MDLEQLVQRALKGDLTAFVALTRRFQHLAFGTALALLGDFHQAEDAVQEAFLSAWSALPALSDPAAFPGWLRGIVRHHAFRTLRRRHLDLVPLEAAEDVASDSRPGGRPARPKAAERRGTLCSCRIARQAARAGDPVLHP